MTAPYGLRNVGAGSRLELVDYGTADARSNAATAAGISSVVFDQVPGDQLWLVDRVVVTHDSASITTCLLYEDEPSPGRLLDFTTAGNADVADENSPVIVRGGASLLVQWSGCSAGSHGTVRITYRVMRRL